MQPNPAQDSRKGSYQPPTHTDTDEENLNIQDNPDESGGDNEDINSIIEYQHKILRKYTMMGLIQYADAPFFHDMVD